MKQQRMKKQKGAVLIIVAICLAMIVGFVGIVADLGQLFVSKTEMQSVVDACSLAAAQELDGTSTAIERARNAGILAANRNKVNLQSEDPGVESSDIEFSDVLTGPFSTSFAPTAAKYARCTKTSPALQTRFMTVLGAEASHSTAAVAVATRTGTPALCVLPVMIAPQTGGIKANKYGYNIGDWMQDSTSYQPGKFEWGSDATSANEVAEQIEGGGVCGLKENDVLITNGTKASLAKAWNTRFGVYDPSAKSITESPPDFTGYSYYVYNSTANPVTTKCSGKDKTCTETTTYTPTGWQGNSNAYSDFLNRRATFQSYGGTTDTTAAGNAITGLSIKNNNTIATHGSSGQLASSGTNRRITLIPIVNSGRAIIDFACVLMLHPIDDVHADIYLEFIGLVDDPTSPCGSSSIAGATSVVTLVQ